MWTPDQTACRSSLIGIYTVCQRDFKNISADDESRRFAVNGAIRVNKCYFSVYTVKIFMKILRSSNNLLTHYQIINKTRFPFLADEIAEPRPDVKIEVATFTVTQKLYCQEMGHDTRKLDFFMHTTKAQTTMLKRAV